MSIPDSRVGVPVDEAQAFAAAMAPLAVAHRSGLRESVHHGVGVAVLPDGSIARRVGDPEVVVYPRSCLKPLQADAMVANGLRLPPDQLAVACASHDGSDVHVAVVRALLADHGLGEDDLLNTPAHPYGVRARTAELRVGRPPARIRQNCSGKHAAMLATCVANGWTTSDYVEQRHPLQVAIGEHLAASGCRIAHEGVDGCGAPAHAFPLVDLARAVGALATGGGPVVDAMRAHPDLVGGPTRDVTRWMRAVGGLVAKEGAAGVMVVALPDGSAAAFKIADGSDQARRAVTVEALRRLGVDVDEAHRSVCEQVAVPVLGHGDVVGSVDALDWSAWSS